MKLVISWNNEPWLSAIIDGTQKLRLRCIFINIILNKMYPVTEVLFRKWMDSTNVII